jgi:hypothetical protein
MDSTEATRKYLRSVMPTKAMVDHFVAAQDAETEIPVDLGGIMCNNAKSTYDPEIGWVVCDGFRGGSVDGSRGFYSYEADGARRVVNSAGKHSRVHAYGNSFTHCDQVSDGETWQEYLAAHLQEPIRNYGIGGHSVYQAYRRMRVVEPQYPAEYVILNVWDDDHFRNLDAWRSIRMGRQGRFTLPYLRVNLETRSCEENNNMCPRPEDLYQFLDEEWVWETFKDDPVLKAVMARKGNGDDAAALEAFGATDLGNSGSDAVVYQAQTEAALFATRCVIEKASAFCEETGKKLLVLLSFSSRGVKQALAGDPLFDQTFLDWLSASEYNWLDLRDAFREDFARHNVSIDEYLEPLYIGHHTPRGNFFFAWALRDRLVEWLDPKPLPYGE